MRRICAAMVLPILLAACSAEGNPRWLGYVEGEAALVAPPQPGWITSVDVMRGAEVKKGDRLFTLDAVREAAARDNAQAQIAAAREQGQQATAQLAQAQAEQAQIEADIMRADKELARQEELVRIGASPRRDLESAQATYDSAKARRSQTQALQGQATAARRQADAQAKQAQASLDTANFNLSERAVRSLVSGRVEDVYFRQGEYAQSGAPVVSILPPENVFVRFFVPEAALANLRPGEQVNIGCDGCPPGLTGTISFIASEAEFTPPVIYSVGNRERLVFKAEARAPSGLPLRPGLPVEVWPVEPASTEPGTPP
ncbi:MAG: HlyD family secretion protein [Longimicrobiales bacterium]